MRNFDGLGARFEQKNWRALLPLFFFLVRVEFRERKMREIVSEFFKCVFGEKRKLKG